MFDPLIFINCRDRVTDLRWLVGWLERAGHERITLLDNESTYVPLLEYLEQTPHTVIRLPENHGSQAVWITGRAPADEWFVLTDPDILPTEHCPTDAVDHLHQLLGRHRSFAKAALGLYLDNVPGSMPSLDWERSLVGVPSLQYPDPYGHELAPGVFASLSDTTFALHRPGTDFRFEAIRTGAPYQARHTSWYATEDLSAEDRYYLEHAAGGEMYSSWAAQKQAA